MHCFASIFFVAELHKGLSPNALDNWINRLNNYLTPKLNSKQFPAFFLRLLCAAANKIRKILVPVFPVNQLTAEVGQILISVI